jgi:acetoin utilization deacetylase AcuC-like enzyme
MTLLYRDARFLNHETGNHPERPIRLRAIESHLERHWLTAQCSQQSFEPCDQETLSLVHARGYIEEISAFAQAGGGYLDADTICSPASFDVAALAAGAVVDAVGRVVAGEDTTALCLVRPPGHHALVDRAMGFCLFNNIAVGAMAAVKRHGLDRVLIVDFDVHHGNGTQAIFWEDSQIGFFSMHRYPFYPGTGAADERGEGKGQGATANLPIEFGTSRDDIQEVFAARLQAFADHIRPQLVMVSAGFDAHRTDPIGSLGLEAEDFAVFTDRVLEVAAAHAGGRIVSVLEGGYNPPALAQSVEEHLTRMLHAPPTSSPTLP